MPNLFIPNLLSALTISVFAVTSSQIVADPAMATEITTPEQTIEQSTVPYNTPDTTLRESQTFVVDGDYEMEYVASETRYEITPPPPPKKETPPEKKTPPAKEKAPYSPPTATNPDPGSAQAYAKQLLASKGLGDTEYSCLVLLWNKESGWRTDAYNASSGAQGIPQALPGNKMSSAGADWETNPQTQIRWGVDYIQGRYSTPCVAWSHSEAHGWY